jgi:exopolysaccharide biosynthesis polyprenyl glycosylphosphotransferase
MENSIEVQRSSFWMMRIAERRVLLMTGDLLMALISLGIALYYWGTSERFMGFTLEFLQKRTPFWFFLLPIIWMILLIELYDVQRAAEWGSTIRGIAMAAVIGFILYLFLFFYYADPPNSLLPRLGVAGFFIAASVLTLLWRLLYIRVFTAPRFLRRVLLVGGGKTGKMLLQVINELRVKPFVVVGVIDDDQEKQDTVIEEIPVIGTSEQLMQLIKENNISDLIVSITGEMRGDMFQAVLDAQQLGLEITRMPVTYEELIGRVPILSLEANWILRSFVDESRVSGFYELWKRVVDIFGGLVGVLIFILVLPFVSLGILIDDGLPIMYGQMRLGRGGRNYRILKFRTMRRDAEANGQPQWATKADIRATRVGRFLRKTHLDEVPQFINVLRGEMSLIGPRAERPELVAMFQEHIPFYRARLLVKPGITGWAQVNFGYASNVNETMVKLEYDLYYIKNRNMLLDIEILFRTPFMMFGFRGR